jgi:hypothetical protein
MDQRNNGQVTILWGFQQVLLLVHTGMHADDVASRMPRGNVTELLLIIDGSKKSVSNRGLARYSPGSRYHYEGTWQNYF